MCFYESSAMLQKRANSCPVSPWTADTVDEILIEGDAMLCSAVASPPPPPIIFERWREKGNKR